VVRVLVLTLVLAATLAFRLGSRGVLWGGQEPSADEGTAEDREQATAARPLGHGTRQPIESLLLHRWPFLRRTDAQAHRGADVTASVTALS